MYFLLKVLILWVEIDSLASNPMEIALQTLENLILNQEPAKGEEFPKIPGPDKSDRVCIVGAGPSGVHMALKLKKLGFENVTIFEKTGRIGGKSYDIQYQGVPYPMGTVFFEPNYFDNFIPLARDYNVGDVKELPPAGLWTRNQASSNITLPVYYLQVLSKFTKSQDPLTNVGFLLTKIIKYIGLVNNVKYNIHTSTRSFFDRLHKELFGDYDGDIMLKPSKEVMERTRGTFLEFLKREDLEPLKVIFKTTHELQGYGWIDEVSALYGLIWNTPKFMFAYARRIMRLPSVEPLLIGIMRYWQPIEFLKFIYV